MKKLLLILAVTALLFSCSEDESNKAEIIDMSITAISSSDILLEDISIESEKNQIFIFLNNNLNNHTFPISLTTDVKLSSGAKTSSFLNNKITFTNADEIVSVEIKAEDGTSKNWDIYLVHLQLQNSNFENWFSNKGMNGEPYQEIGNSSVTSVWATANMGTSTYKVYGTKPSQIGDNAVVEIKTQEAGNLPITAGTLFAGTFSLANAIKNPTDPEQATIFGTPFIFRPSGFKFKYKYQAGERYIQGTLNSPTNIFGGFTITDIDGEDQCSIYAFLEVRNGDQIKEIARVKMESGTTDDVLTEKELSFEYTSSENPTHITIVFSSSTGGALWRGAVGSTLIVDDLELVYE